MQIQNTNTVVQGPGNRDFIHMYNVSDVVIYISYNGEPATVANSVPLFPGGVLHLNNDGSKQIFTKGVNAIHEGAGEKELRVQVA